MNERIVCAANKCSITGKIILGIRHWDIIMHDVSFLAQCDAQRDSCTVPEFDKQGFITNKGRFVDRQEAWKIAEAEGQILRRCGGDTANGGTLYSENLY